MANTRVAPNSIALEMHSWPTGPQPNTATVSPGLISASFAAKYAVGKMSDSKMASSSLTSSGSLVSVTCAKGMRAYSACSP